MAKTSKKSTKRPATKQTKRDRHSTPVILLIDGTIIATKKRVEAFKAKHPNATILAEEVHHYAMLRFLRVAKDESGALHIATQSRADEEGWDVLA